MTSRASTTVTRTRVALALGLVAAAVLVGFGLSRVSVDTTVASFLPDGTSARALNQKASDFGGDPVVVLLQATSRRGLFTDPDQLGRLVNLEGTLADLNGVAAVYGPGTALNQTAGAAQDMLAQISGRRDGYRRQIIAAAQKDGRSPAEVKQLADAATQRFDERYGPLMVQGMPTGLPTLSNPAFVRSVLFDPTTELPRDRWRTLLPGSDEVAVLVRPGPSVDAAGAAALIDQIRAAVAKSGLELTSTTVSGPPAIAAALADQSRHELPLLGAVAVAAVAGVLLLMPWSARRRARLRPLVAALIGSALTTAAFGLSGHALSLGVVAFVPILLGIGSDFPLYYSRGGKDRSVVVTAVAAAVAFGSLAISPLPFVRELGIALAAGLFVSLGVAAALRLLLGPVAPESAPEVKTSEAGRAAWSRNVRLGVAAVAAALALVGWALLPGLQVEARPDVLAAGLPALHDADRVAAILGSDGEVSVVVTGDNVASPAALRWESAANDRIISRLGNRIHPLLALSDLLRFLGDKPSAAEVSGALEVVPRYLTSAVLRSDGREGLMVYGVEYDDVDALGRNLDQLQSALGTPPPGIHVQVVGLPEAAAHGLEAVSGERVWLNLAGLGLAALVLLVGLRDRRTALVAIATVVVATGWSVVLAKLAVGELSPLTVGIGSLVTATGCEFAVMLRHGAGRRLVLTAALAGVGGYLALAFSRLAVLRDFGLLLAGGVACSVLAALLIDRLLACPSEAAATCSQAVEA